jgi:hypothetical protein
VTALDDAVKAAMRDAGCLVRRCGCAVLPEWECYEHDCTSDRDECSVVGSAVRAGWAAAIDAAAEVAAWPHVETSHEMDVRRECVSNVRALRLPEGDQP